MGFAFLPSQTNFGICPDNVVKLPLDLPEARIDRALGWHKNNKNASTHHFLEIVRRQS